MKDTHSKIVFALFTFCAVAIIALFIRVNKKGVEIVSTLSQKKVSAEIKKTKLTVSRAEVDVYFNDIEKMLSSARAVPHKNGEDVVGFEFTEIQNDSLWKKLGIQDGDVVTHINDEALSSGANMLNVFSDLKSASELEIKILRKQEPLILQISLR